MPHHNNQEVVLTFSGHDYTSLQRTMLTEVNHNSSRVIVAQHNRKHTKPSLQRNVEGIGNLQKEKEQVLIVNLAAISLLLSQTDSSIIRLRKMHIFRVWYVFYISFGQTQNLTFVFPTRGL